MWERLMTCALKAGSPIIFCTSAIVFGSCIIDMTVCIIFGSPSADLRFSSPSSASLNTPARCRAAFSSSHSRA